MCGRGCSAESSLRCWWTWKCRTFRAVVHFAVKLIKGSTTAHYEYALHVLRVPPAHCRLNRRLSREAALFLEQGSPQACAVEQVHIHVACEARASCVWWGRELSHHSQHWCETSLKAGFRHIASFPLIQVLSSYEAQAGNKVGQVLGGSMWSGGGCLALSDVLGIQHQLLESAMAAETMCLPC